MPPAEGPASAPQKPNVLALIALIMAVVGFIFACIPGALIVGWVLLPIAFVLSIVSLFLKGSRKWMGVVGLVLSIIGTIVGFVVFFAVIANAAEEAFGDEFGNGETTVTQPADEDADPAAEEEAPAAEVEAFADNVLTLSDVTVTITDVKKIAVGEPGNEYGEKPVIAFWYEVTNASGGDIDPTTAWITAFRAYQDNDPNAMNELNIASLPDAQFLDSQREKIKTGRTGANAVAYDLDEETTPGDLVASENLGMTELGRATFELD